MPAKLVLILFVSFIISVPAFAQAGKPVFYFKTNGTRVGSKDSADYYRVITKTDSAGTLFIDYNQDNSIRIRGFTSGQATEPGIVTGNFTSYYKNGKLFERHEFESRHPTKTFRYFQNGALMQYVLHDNKTFIDRIMFEADSLGNANISNGEGAGKQTLTSMHDSFTETVSMEGPFKNGLKEGLWKGTDDKGLSFEQIYEKGRVVSGTSRTQSGKSYHYTIEFKYPVLKGGHLGMNTWVKENMESPADTASFKYLFQGDLRLTYHINDKGEITKIIAYKASDNEAVALKLKKSPPKAGPALLRGMPVSYDLPSGSISQLVFQSDVLFKGGTYKRISDH